MLLTVFFKIDTLFFGDLRFVGLWPRRPHVDPPLEISDYGVRQLVCGGISRDSSLYSTAR